MNKQNEDEVWTTLYGYIYGELRLPKFKVDDTVRVSKYTSIFTKGYEANFTEKLFKITKVIHGDLCSVQDFGGTRGRDNMAAMLG